MSNNRLPLLRVVSGAKRNLFSQLGAQAKEPDFVPFQYAPLGDQQIRVLSISVEPVTGLLVCNFDIRDLETSIGTYRAISYCWGDPTPSHRVLFGNGQSLIVTRSAAEILTHVFPRHPQDTFWIDQLCINQADKVEKSAQVLLMGQIYASTKQVIAWLGCGDADSEKAVRFVETLSKEVEDMKRKGLQPTLEPMMSSAPRFRNLATEMSRERKWSALSRLLRNSWFERVWVMQEIIMACTLAISHEEDHTVISFEKCSISFDMLAEVLGILENDHLSANLVYDRQHDDGTKEDGVVPPGINAVGLFSALRDMRSKGTLILLNAALRDAWHHKASNARDKLYAVLGYCDDATDGRLRPDYESTVEDIYKAWTTVLLERDDEDAMPLPLAGIGLQRSFTNLPSWVPDFSSGSYEVRSSSGLGAGRLYQASGEHRNSEIVVAPSSQSIVLQGIPIDTVDSLFPQPSVEKPQRWYHVLKPLLFTPDSDKFRSLLQWLGNVETFLRASPAPRETERTQLKEVLWQTMIGDYPSEGAPIDGNLAEAFESWYRAHRELAGKDKAGLFAHQTRTAEFYDQIQTFEDLKAGSLQERPIFGTARRRLLGHGPMGLLAGDTVFVVKGARTPFLLREVEPGDEREDENTKWRLVGPCFVHGFMYGEGLHMGEWTNLVVV